MKNKRKNNWFMWEVKLSEIVRCFPFCMSRFIPSFFFCVWKFFHHGKKILNTKGQNVRKSTYFLTYYTNKASQSGINMSESNIDSALAKLRRSDALNNAPLYLSLGIRLKEQSKDEEWLRISQITLNIGLRRKLPRDPITFEKTPCPST